ncbi:hypothetical protein PAXINDRAFT_12496 [Paxillus involutus ATCC 200175]|uniref:Uncharacterized protein n=1 Tax=Paxillus involutus ATCC 200175 TaxID=664439 RepID=A0A0C9U6E1_PAXIN|nr:hypothetical protein PAXINDRAFT_12496 [Paxillus involutus ATCC 200175]
MPMMLIIFQTAAGQPLIHTGPTCDGFRTIGVAIHSKSGPGDFVAVEIPAAYPRHPGWKIYRAIPTAIPLVTAEMENSGRVDLQDDEQNL